MFLSLAKNRIRDMSINPTRVDHLSTFHRSVEFRSKPRIYDPFPVTVHGVDIDGETFEFETIVDNISAGGLYLRLMRCIERGVKLLVVIRLSTAPSDDVSAPRIVTHGEVLRAESKPGGVCCVAIAFTHHHFL